MTWPRKRASLGSRFPESSTTSRMSARKRVSGCAARWKPWAIRSIVPVVGIDERKAGRTIGEHLAALGHSRLGFLKGPPEHQSATLRYDGFLDALRDAGIAGEPWTATGDFTFRSGVDAAERMLR